MNFDPLRLSDEELYVLLHAFDELRSDQRTQHGADFRTTVLQASTDRQMARASEEGWHVSHQFPNPPDWEAKSE